MVLRLRVQETLIMLFFGGKSAWRTKGRAYPIMN